MEPSIKRFSTSGSPNFNLEFEPKESCSPKPQISSSISTPIVYLLRQRIAEINFKMSKNVWVKEEEEKNLDFRVLINSGFIPAKQPPM